jgi:predicted methyltransferase
MKNPIKQNAVAAAVGSLLIGSVAGISTASADSPFAMTSLESGYMVAEAKMGEGKWAKANAVVTKPKQPVKKWAKANAVVTKPKQPVKKWAKANAAATRPKQPVKKWAKANAVATKPKQPVKANAVKVNVAVLRNNLDLP